MGGNCRSATSTGGGVGYDQTWQDVRASRAPGVAYRNTTEKPVTVNFTRGTIDGFSTVNVSTDNVNWVQGTICWRGTICSAVVVVLGQWYRVNVGPVYNWSELR